MSSPLAPHIRLGWHVAGTVLTESVNAAVIGMLPFIALRSFAAADWQIMLVTLAVPAWQIVSIFWSQWLETTAIRRYTMALWSCAWAPFGLACFVHSFWPLLALCFSAAIGTAGLYPLKGELLRRLYPLAARGRFNGVLNSASLLMAATLAFLLGWWLYRDGEAFRVYMPIAIAVQLLGTLILIGLAGRETADRQHAARPSVAGWLGPIRGMHRILRDDPIFRRYEYAFMTYGAGYMICEVLLPLLVGKRLHMDYSTIANSTRVVWQTAVVIVSLPAGWLLDRLGPARISALSFAVLAFYPLVLTVAGDPYMIAVASAIYGVALAGVNQGWMLGPVALAPRPELVQQYVAVHTTLVGVRGVAFQSIGLLLYWLTDTFVVPFLAAAAFFGWGAWQMHRLHGRWQLRDAPLLEKELDTEAPAPDLAVTEAG